MYIYIYIYVVGVIDRLIGHLLLFTSYCFWEIVVDKMGQISRNSLYIVPVTVL